MYEKFFGLTRSPFPIVPDPDSVHVTGQHADVISGAVFGVLERKGFVVLTGEAGLGKSTAIRGITHKLDRHKTQTSIISHPTLNASDFLELAMLNFGLRDVSSSKAQRLKILESFLLEADAQDRLSLLVIDEAHKLPKEALEEVRLLGNLETDKHKLLQILLVGQNELNERLDLPELWQLKQRVAFRLTLTPLNRNGVEDYLAFRWGKAGGGRLPFDKGAIDALATWSHGIPRVIHAICDNALMLALSEGLRDIGREQIQLACQDLHLATPGTDAIEPVIEGAVPLARVATVGGLAGETVSNRKQERSHTVALAAPPVPTSTPDGYEPPAPSLWKKWKRRAGTGD